MTHNFAMLSSRLLPSPIHSSMAGKMQICSLVSLLGVLWYFLIVSCYILCFRGLLYRFYLLICFYIMYILSVIPSLPFRLRQSESKVPCFSFQLFQIFLFFLFRFLEWWNLEHCLALSLMEGWILLHLYYYNRSVLKADSLRHSRTI